VIIVCYNICTCECFVYLSLKYLNWLINCFFRFVYSVRLSWELVVSARTQIDTNQIFTKSTQLHHVIDLIKLCTHSAGTNSTKAMVAMSWCSRQKSLIKILLNWNTNMAAVTSCANVICRQLKLLLNSNSLSWRSNCAQ
jgi:hypothetical protein